MTKRKKNKQRRRRKIDSNNKIEKELVIKTRSDWIKKGLVNKKIYEKK